MTPALEVPAHQLALAHLQQAPVWRFLAAGESADPEADESLVRADQAPGLGSTGSFLIAATFTLASGLRLPGLVQVDVLAGQVALTPCTLWAQGKPVSALGRDTATRLGRILQADNTQPVSWQLAVPLHGEQAVRQGTIARAGWRQALGLLLQLGRWRLMR